MLAGANRTASAQAQAHGPEKAPLLYLDRGVAQEATGGQAPRPKPLQGSDPKPRPGAGGSKATIEADLRHVIHWQFGRFQAALPCKLSA